MLMLSTIHYVLGRFANFKNSNDLNSFSFLQNRVSGNTYGPKSLKLVFVGRSKSRCNVILTFLTSSPTIPSQPPFTSGFSVPQLPSFTIRSSSAEIKQKAIQNGCRDGASAPRNSDNAMLRFGKNRILGTEKNKFKQFELK